MDDKRGAGDGTKREADREAENRFPELYIVKQLIEILEEEGLI